MPVSYTHLDVYKRQLDPRFPKHLADGIKSSWAGNYFEGKRGDGMVVAERDGGVVGFLQLLWAETGCLVVDLIGLDSAWQGQGIGRDMILYAVLHGTCLLYTSRCV